jgi:pyruvate formate lyase activating enzyme
MTPASCTGEPLKELCSAVDAINVDFKSYSKSFYEDVVGGHLDTLLENLKLIATTNVWLEVTNLVVPGYSDDPTIFQGMCQWIAYYLGVDTPLHVSRFFPAYRLRNVAATPVDKLRELRKLAYQAGLHYVYLGNLAGDPAECTYCPKCGNKVIQRIGYDVTNTGLDLDAGRCGQCRTRIPGIWSV